MIKRLKHALIFVSFFYAFLSCDPTDFELPSYQVNMYLPVIDLELGLQDLILADSSATLDEDSTGLVSLNYKLSERRTFDELFIPYDENQEFTLPGISSEIPDTYVNILLHAENLGITPGYYSEFLPWEKDYESETNVEEFIEAEFKGGTIRLEITNNFPFVIDDGLVIELVNSGEEVPFVEFALTESINPGNMYTFSDVDITNLRLTGKFTIRMNNLSTPGGTDITIDSGDMLDVRISYINIALKEAVFLAPNSELPSVNVDLPLVFSTGALIQELRIDSGYISIDMPNLNSSFFVKLTLPSATQNGNPFSFNFGENETIISLDNLDIDLSTLTPAYNLLPMEIQLMYSESIDTFDIVFDTPIEGEVGIFDFDYDYMIGYLGKIDDVMKESINLDFFHQIRSGALIFKDPQFTFTFDNELGAGFTVMDDGAGLFIRGSNSRLYGDRTVTIGNSLDGFGVAEASSQEDSEISMLILDETTEPDFNEFLGIFPTFLEARIPVTMGTDVVNMNQFLDDKAALHLDIELELPLNMVADRFIITDTSEYSVDLDNRKFIVSSGKFQARIESYFPVELDMQNIFLDSNKNVLDSLFDVRMVLDPAEFDHNGEITDPFVKEIIINMDSDQLDNLRNTAFLVANIRIQTPESKYVRLLSSNKLIFKLIGEIQTEIDLNQ